MEEAKFDGHHGRSVAIDICHACQSFWFDARESVALTPGSTLALFRVIGEKLMRPQHTDSELAKCSRCKGRLRRTQDMQRAMARQAEAEREKRAKIIHAEGELIASEKLSQAAAVIDREPAAMTLRYLQTLTEIASEQNSTIIFPLPIELIRMLREK